MNRHQTTTMALLLLALSMTAKTSSAETPNIVLIMADDLGYGDVGCYGNPVNRTPHIDALAASGLRFTDFHSAGPMCSPTRAAMLTGQYQQRFGRIFDKALSGVITGTAACLTQQSHWQKCLKGKVTQRLFWEMASRLSATVVANELWL
jgi:arylsulfatase A-like enzyme